LQEDDGNGYGEDDGPLHLLRMWRSRCRHTGTPVDTRL
jgi:hypothetical protein